MLKRDKKNGMIGGVCAGLASAFGVPVVVMRLLAVFGLLWAGLAGLAYILLWILLPVGDEMHFLGDIDKVRRDPNNALIAGVCGAVATYLGANPGVIRLFWLIAVVWFGFGLIPYLILWICIPKKAV